MTVLSAPAGLKNPYPGLRPFEEADFHLFFGRDEQIDELLRRLSRGRFVCVTGVSGSGKSSLVKAGLIPALRRGYVARSGSRWRIATCRPGDNPIAALAEALSEGAQLTSDLERSSHALVHAAQSLLPEESLLVVVDQFEELFRYKEKLRVEDEAARRHKAKGAERAAHFVRLLLTAAADESVPVYVVLTMRSDYLGDCAQFRDLPEALNGSQYLVPRMTRNQRREAIEGPLGDSPISPALVQQLLNDAGDDPDQLPVLQHVLMRMWDLCKRTAPGPLIGREHYDFIGGWDDALSRHADDVWGSLGERRDLAKRIFQRLTGKAQAGREVRRPATVHELAAVAATAVDAVIAVVEHYRAEGCSFLTSPSRVLTEESVIDISHESLIRRWKQLQLWIEEEADWGAWYRRVEDRKRMNGSYFVDPELELALQAQQGGRWNEAWAQRYASPDSSYHDVIGFLEESRRSRDGGLEVYFAQVILRMTPEPEQKHLFNLHDGRTKGYQGRGTLQAELRHLAASGLLVRKQGRTIGEMRRGTVFDLADYVELTDLGKFLINYAEQEGRSELARAVSLAEKYLGPIDLREAERVAAQIRETFENARTQPTLRSVQPYLQHSNAAHRVVGYLACQVAAQRGNISTWVPELARCFAEEQDEACKNQETRPLWQLLVCISYVLKSEALSEPDRARLRNGLEEMLKFLRAHPHLDSGGQCKWKIGELLV